jgi:hypothetical protein
MAKRAPWDEKPFRPLDVSILNSVVKHVPDPGRSVALPEGTQKLIQSASVSSIRNQQISEARIVPLAPVVQRLDQEKRILFTRDETQAIDRLVSNLAVRFRTQVKVSHVMRALSTLMLNAEGQIDQRAGEHGLLNRPPNGDFSALQEFEREIARIIASGIRDAGPLR